MPHSPPSPCAPLTRRVDNDWLTIGATLLVFLFHCARFFNDEDWHVKNNQIDQTLSLFVAFAGQWMMPLFFVLSGISSQYSLSGRDGRGYLGNRLQRLLIPLAFGTLVVLIPLQVWIERVSHGQFEGSFLAFYPHYFSGFYAFGGNFAWMGLHLWYLEMLLLFTLLTYPLFRLLKRPRQRRLIARLTAPMGRGAAPFAVIVPLLLVELLVNLQPEGVGIRAFGGWSPFAYLAFFITGFLLAGDPGVRTAMQRLRHWALLLGVGASGLLLGGALDLVASNEALQYVLGVLLRAGNAWFWLIAVLGYGSRHLSFDHAWLRYAREAAMPFYVLHQTVIVAIGFWIADWDLHTAWKYLLLSSLALAIILASYELLIKRLGPLRLVFGMPAAAPPPKPAEQAATT